MKPEEHIEQMGGQDPTLNNHMPMMAIEQSEQSIRRPRNAKNRQNNRPQ